MKKVFILLLFVSALVACSKLEVTPMEQNSKAAITYQTAPITKARGQFAQSYIFESAAYYLSPTFSKNSWLNDGEKSTLYISPATVSYTNGKWQMAKPYYWPKDGGTLTFFSWSLNSTTLTFNEGSKASVTIEPEVGVHLKDFDITVDGDIDFIVADIAYDKTQNQHEYYNDGVPTLFRHKLSQVKFTAETDADYSASQTFYIRSITITNVAKTGEYKQGTVDTQTTPCWKTVDQWIVGNDTYSVDYLKYNGTEDSYATDGLEVTNKVQNIESTQYYYIPETFDDSNEIVVCYQIKDKSSGIVENVTLIKSLKNIIGNSFKVGTIYTINLRFHLDEITWDPAIENWDISTNEIDI
jgi:hypothetical protein